MDNQYGIGVNNRYELFLGEDESVDILRSRAATKEPKKKSKVAEKENKPIQPESKSKTSSGAREGIKETQNLKNVPKKTDTAKTGPKPKVENTKPKPDSDVKKPKFESAKPAPRTGDSREERNNRRNREDRPERNSQNFNYRNRDGHNDGSDSKPERIDRFGDRFGETSDRPERSERTDRRERPDRFGDRFGETRGERSERGRGGRGDRGDRGERGDRGDRGDRGERGDRGDRGDRVDRGDRSDRGDRGDRPYRSDHFDRFDSNKDGEPGNEGEGGRGRGRGMGRGRGRGRGGFEGRGGRRDFDRQSRSDRTGVKPVDKREGGGSHNWGTHRDELDETVNNSLNESNDWNGGNPEDNTNASEQTGKRNKDDAEPTTNGDTQQEPPEPKELTLEEWKALKGTREKPQYNIRKAGEGEDLSQYKNMVVLQKKSDNAAKPSIESEPHDEPAHNKQSSKRQNVVDINLHFSDNRTMRGRGGRGGGRGRRGGGGGGDDSKFHQNREPKVPKQSAPKVDDEHDFPSLG